MLQGWSGTHRIWKEASRLASRSLNESVEAKRAVLLFRVVRHSAPLLCLCVLDSGECRTGDSDYFARFQLHLPLREINRMLKILRERWCRNFLNDPSHLST